MTESKPQSYPIILCGDHAEFEAEYANTPANERPDWPLPSFDAQDWATAFCKRNPGIDESVMLSWFANALMRGYDEHAARARKPSPEPQWPWQSMDSAPRDGTKVLLHVDWEPLTVVGFFGISAEQKDGAEPTWRVAWDHGAIRDGFDEPTHWMPIHPVDSTISPIPPERVPEALRELAEITDRRNRLLNQLEGAEVLAFVNPVNLRNRASRLEADLAGKRSGT